MAHYENCLAGFTEVDWRQPCIASKNIVPLATKRLENNIPERRDLATVCPIAGIVFDD